MAAGYGHGGVSGDTGAENGDYVLSGWWPRVAATFIDGLILAVVTGVVLRVFGFDFGEYFEDDASLTVATRTIDFVYLGASVPIAALYFVPLMVRWRGQTVGKRALGIAVIRADRRPLDAGTVILRQIVAQYILVSVLPVLGPVNYALPLLDGQNRAGHDFLARTRVVRASTARRGSAGGR